MTDDDPRHGTNAGWLKHRHDNETPCQACKDARNRNGKQLRYLHARGVRLTYTPQEALAAVQHFLDQGITPSALDRCLGLTRAGILTRCAKGQVQFVRRNTYEALTNITEDDIPETARCNADLTRKRIFSLMAAGHELQDMPVHDRGKWRTANRISVRFARAMRDYYRTHEGRLGHNVNTAGRALGLGHETPLAWDDPGTLAWTTPTPTSSSRTSKRSDDFIDEVVVDKILRGEKVYATRAEQEEVVRRVMADPERTLADLERDTELPVQSLADTIRTRMRRAA